VTAALPRIDVLVHCAAVFIARRTTTTDGRETMFATNQLAL
jgi:NAD(P)-dependent dehydrogenase (short-subunit alcohol dehydrogenase family)